MLLRTQVCFLARAMRASQKSLGFFPPTHVLASTIYVCSSSTEQIRASRLRHGDVFFDPKTRDENTISNNCKLFETTSNNGPNGDYLRYLWAHVGGG